MVTFLCFPPLATPQSWWPAQPRTRQRSPTFIHVQGKCCILRYRCAAERVSTLAPTLNIRCPRDDVEKGEFSMNFHMHTTPQKNERGQHPKNEGLVEVMIFLFKTVVIFTFKMLVFHSFSGCMGLLVRKKPTRISCHETGNPGLRRSNFRMHCLIFKGVVS